MQTKSYFASSVPAALEAARAELGENALLVSSRPTPPETRQFGRLEVTFAYDPADRSAAASGAARIPPPRETLTERLVRAGLSPELATDIGAAADIRPENPDLAVVEELVSRIRIAPWVDMQPGENRAIAFIGPPGRGKTMSLAKLAVNRGISRRLPVRICSTGPLSAGAKERIARFASILGTPFQAHESLAGLYGALEDESWTGLTLIDTPGISPADRNDMTGLRNLFLAHPGIERHLVLRADAGASDMLCTISRFSALGPSRLMFTGMDEIVRVSSVIETLIRGGIPATFAGTGQHVPQDIQEINADRLARAIFVDARHTPGGLATSATA